MRCYRCGVHYSAESSNVLHVQDRSRPELGYQLGAIYCPDCLQLHITLQEGRFSFASNEGYVDTYGEIQVIYPQAPTYRVEGVEGAFGQQLSLCRVIGRWSPLAAVLLARTLLQYFLRATLSIRRASLQEEIEEFVKAVNAPDELRDAMHAARQVANKVAHPEDRLPHITPEEADFLVELLEVLVERFVVTPKREEELRRRLRTVLGEMRSSGPRG